MYQVGKETKYLQMMHGQPSIKVRKLIVEIIGVHHLEKLQEAGGAPGPVWTGAENIAPTGIRSPDRPARSQSLYRLSYPAQIITYTML